jgi:hypothetical protein
VRTEELASIGCCGAAVAAGTPATPLSVDVSWRIARLRSLSCLPSCSLAARWSAMPRAGAPAEPPPPPNPPATSMSASIPASYVCGRRLAYSSGITTGRGMYSGWYRSVTNEIGRPLTRLSCTFDQSLSV